MTKEEMRQPRLSEKRGGNKKKGYGAKYFIDRTWCDAKTRRQVKVSEVR